MLVFTAKYTANMCNPKISVITVCRNVLADVQRTAASVMEQTYTNYEYIFVDGASTDGTVEWLKEQNGIIWCSEPDKGIYDAMNKGVRLAKGEWIIFMNAGDTFYDKDVLHRIAPYLENEYGLVYGDIVKERKGQEVIKHAELPHNSHRMFFCHQALFTRTDLLRETPFDTTHKLSADFKFVKQMYLKSVPMRYVPQVIACFDTHGVSNTRLTDGLEDNIAVIREVDTNRWERLCFIFRLQFKILWTRIRHIR